MIIVNFRFKGLIWHVVYVAVWHNFVKFLCCNVLIKSVLYILVVYNYKNTHVTYNLFIMLSLQIPVLSSTGQRLGELMQWPVVIRLSVVC